MPNQGELVLSARWVRTHVRKGNRWQSGQWRRAPRRETQPEPTVIGLRVLESLAPDLLPSDSVVTADDGVDLYYRAPGGIRYGAISLEHDGIGAFVSDRSSGEFHTWDIRESEARGAAIRIKEFIGAGQFATLQDARLVSGD